jgi:hypothetical protein
MLITNTTYDGAEIYGIRWSLDEVPYPIQSRDVPHQFLCLAFLHSWKNFGLSWQTCNICVLPQDHLSSSGTPTCICVVVDHYSLVCNDACLHLNVQYVVFRVQTNPSSTIPFRSRTWCVYTPAFMYVPCVNTGRSRA